MQINKMGENKRFSAMTKDMFTLSDMLCANTGS